MNTHIDLTDVPVNELLKTVEGKVMEQVLAANRYNQSKTAKALGISRGTLRTKLEEQFPGKYIGKKGE